MKVYVVMNHIHYEGDWLNKVFSSLEDAKEYISKGFGNDKEFNYVDGVVVHEMVIGKTTAYNTDKTRVYEVGDFLYR